MSYRQPFEERPDVVMEEDVDGFLDGYTGWHHFMASDIVDLYFSPRDEGEVMIVRDDQLGVSEQSELEAMFKGVASILCGKPRGQAPDRWQVHNSTLSLSHNPGDKYDVVVFRCLHRRPGQKSLVYEFSKKLLRSKSDKTTKVLAWYFSKRTDLSMDIENDHMRFIRSILESYHDRISKLEQQLMA